VQQTDDFAVVDPSGQHVLGRTVGIVALTATVGAVVAGTTIWLLVTDPVAVANAVDAGEISPLAQQIAAALYQALLGILAYL
jgi:ABC-type Na+ efflux pump permease subunit